MNNADECRTERLAGVVPAGLAGAEEAEDKLNQSINRACEMMVGTRLIISAMFEGNARSQGQDRTRDFLIGWSYELLDIEQHLKESWQEYTAQKTGNLPLLDGN